MALRKLRDPAVAMLLRDNDPFIAAEAARAVHDAEINDAFPALAALADEFSAQPSIAGETRHTIEWSRWDRETKRGVKLRDDANFDGKPAETRRTRRPWRCVALDPLRARVCRLHPGTRVCRPRRSAGWSGRRASRSGGRRSGAARPPPPANRRLSSSGSTPARCAQNSPDRTGWRPRDAIEIGYSTRTKHAAARV